MQAAVANAPVRDRILVVDDSDIDRMLLRLVLEQGGYDVLAAEDGSQALALLETMQPDLILLDVCMPDMDGYALCRKIRSRSPTSDTPIIFVSGNAGSEDRVKAFDSGGVDYLIKPIEASETLARVRTHLALQALRRDLDERVRQRTGELESAYRRLVAEVAERRAAEESLRERNALIHCLVDANIIGIMFFKGDGTLIDANAAFVELFGVARADIHEGHINWQQLVVPEQRKDTVAALSMAATITRFPPVEKICLRPDGSRFPVLVGAAKPFEQNHIIAFVLDLTERKRIEQALRESQQHLRDLAAHGDAAMEQERKRIAREIHDEQGSLLTALKLELSLLGREWSAPPGAVTTRLESMKRLIDETVRVMRQVSSQLRPAALNLGLLPSLEWLANDFCKRTGTACHLEAACEVMLDDVRATALFRIVQESLTNVTRHAAAAEVTISLESSDTELLVIIKDDGKGFDPAAIGGQSFGLRGIRERLEILGGSLSILSAPGAGTTLRVLIPTEREQP